MVFSSIIFVFIFLPIVLISYFMAEKSNKMFYKNLVVLIASLIFYFWGGLKYLLLLMILVVVNYLCGIMIGREKYRKLFLVIGLTIDVLDLLYFKYLNFLADNASVILRGISSGRVSFELEKIALPIGISFFTFQIMSYLIDVYNRKVPVQRNIWRLMLYIMMFPQLIAGPIVRYSDVNKEIEKRHTTVEMAENGVKRFVIGFAKKVFIANAMGSMADAAFSMSGQLNTAYAWMGAISYSLQIYYDFSAYSDMAIGLGLLLGFHFNENFRYPYVSQSIKEFWRRWHISLSSWFRDYVYIPLGGNRKGSFRTYINLGIVFLLTGIWHGAAWQFIVWGIYHGAFILIERMGFDKVLSKLPKPVRHIYSCVVVIVGWVFFRAESLNQAWNYITNMFTFSFSNFAIEAIVLKFTPMYFVNLAVALILCAPIYEILRERIHLKVVSNIMYLVLFSVSVIYLVGLSYNPFIYFKF